LKLRIKQAILCALAVTVVLFACWLRIDSHAIPATVDLTRNVIGDANMLKLEMVYYTAENAWVQKSFAHAVSTGAVRPVQANSITPLVRQTLNLPDELCHGALAGTWINEGSFYRTSICPEDTLGSVADIVFIEKSQADLKLVCGTEDPAPGGSGRILHDDLPKAFMAFSGGFQYRHDRCGIVIAGKMLRPMKKRAGTICVYTDGTVRIGRWGRDFTTLPPQVTYARQCLSLIDHGRFTAEEPFDCYALGNKFYVYRSALGVTKNGNLVYAAGNALSARGLAKAMITAGVVNAMHLDMNYGNATCGVIRNNRIQPLTKRFPSPNRFLGTNSRDFFYIAKKK
jgi:hypothetical protein